MAQTCQINGGYVPFLHRYTSKRSSWRQALQVIFVWNTKEFHLSDVQGDTCYGKSALLP